MKVNSIKVGMLSCNCYFLEKERKVILIDPGDEISLIEKEIQEKELIAIFITHYHFDHVGALYPLLEKYNVPVFDFHKEGKQKIGPFSFSIISTPGHSKDSVTYYFEEENKMFCGDFIFKGSIGRCDLEGGDEEKMMESIEKIKNYPDALLFPGHGPVTTLKEEKEKNPYF